MYMKDVVSRKGVSRQSIYDILNDPERKQAIFPGAVKHGEGRAGIWEFDPADVEAWQPRRYPRK
ncbi:hypothetical protein HC928_01300 [bacterium]|nr:hypothetical protein [bacterium]